MVELVQHLGTTAFAQHLGAKPNGTQEHNGAGRNTTDDVEAGHLIGMEAGGGRARDAPRDQLLGDCPFYFGPVLELEGTQRDVFSI